METTRTQILDAIAERLGKAVNELQPWKDYDPIMVDERLARVRTGSTHRLHWTGD